MRAIGKRIAYCLGSITHGTSVESYCFSSVISVLLRSFICSWPSYVLLRCARPGRYTVLESSNVWCWPFTSIHQCLFPAYTARTTIMSLTSPKYRVAIDLTDMSWLTLSTTPPTLSISFELSKYVPCPLRKAPFASFITWPSIKAPVYSCVGSHAIASTYSCCVRESVSNVHVNCSAW